MCKHRFFFAIVMLFVSCVTVLAQEDDEEEAYQLGYKPVPYGFVQLQGGVGTPLPFADSFSSGIKPTASVGVGAMFGRTVGARLHVNAWESTGVLNQNPFGGSSTFNYVNTNIDLMVNVTNFFRHRSNYLFNLYVLGGPGWKYYWNNNTCSDATIKEMQRTGVQAPGENQEKSTMHGVNFRAGVLMDFNIHKHWNIGLEVDINDNRYGTSGTVPVDGLVTAQLSLTYKFGHKKVSRPAPEPVAPVAPVHEETVAPAVAVAKPAVQIEPINETIFFEIRAVDTAANYQEVVDRVAAWCKKYPNKTVTIDGYADKGTGNEKINSAYAEQRAKNFAAALHASGISESQTIVRHHGQSIQPFAENDQNRCVIIEGK